MCYIFKMVHRRALQRGPSRHLMRRSSEGSRRFRGTIAQIQGRLTAAGRRRLLFGNADGRPYTDAIPNSPLVCTRYVTEESCFYAPLPSISIWFFAQSTVSVTLDRSFCSSMVLVFFLQVRSCCQPRSFRL